MGLVPRPDPERRERWIAAALFFATCCTVFGVYATMWLPGVPFAEGGSRALVFTFALMTILLLHELGHVALALQHRFAIGWPWFLPFPFFFGTLGAVIRMRETPRDRTGLLEMGAAGPLLGFGCTVLVIALWGVIGPTPPAAETLELEPPLIFRLAAASGWVPAQLSASDPLAFAAWIGCLVTAMNLVPVGQLDGGHLVAALWPRAARSIGWVALVALLGFGLWWPGWAVWAALLAVSGARHPVPVRRPEPGPTIRARWLAIGCAVTFVLTATPAPIRW